MQYDEFFSRFGGSLRTKNIRKKNWLGVTKRRGRDYNLPSSSELPRGFIRLCPWEAEYLFMVASRARLGIIETGRFNGGSAFLMSCAAPDVPIWSIDIEPQDDRRLREVFQSSIVGKNVSLVIGDSQHEKYPEVGTADLLFIDGDHTYDGCMNDLKNWYWNLAPGGHLILHDSYRGKHGVQAAVADLLSERPELSVVLSPFIGADYWNYRAGSLAHLMKGPEK
jgi:predicted O-methyltransferase YrrM